MKTSGFTLIELLVVIVILALLIGLGSKGLRSARISAKKAKARMEMKSIETGIMAYYNKYGKLPAPDTVQGSEDFDDSEAIITTITGNDEGLNPAKYMFLSPQGNGDGIFNDSWGAQYLIVLDTDYDGFIKVVDQTMERKVGVASVGLRGYTGSINDVIYSWD